MAQSKDAPEDTSVDVSAEEEASIRDQLPHRSPVLFEIIRRSGQEELERPLLALWWSGLAAGLSIGFSVLTPAMLRRWLPAADWAILVSQIGYSVGFVIVILSRQQLFTENVITAVVPVMAKSHLHNLLLMLRLWAIVLVANVVGGAVFAAFLVHGGAVDAPLAHAIHAVSEHLLEAGGGKSIASGVVSGFLIASLVWILAGVEGSKLSIIVLMTSLIAIGGFDHVVAGSVEAMYLVLTGAQSLGDATTRFFLPTLFGNVLGGTALFTLLAYGQIRSELKDERETVDDDARADSHGPADAPPVPAPRRKRSAASKKS